ncbi:hypothetical protein ScalyP_jg10298 [Parmales sp. scaly parma]|nr:hypothetical protein ScalyP_jg10298 [Parmales sp. scaly parma]
MKIYLSFLLVGTVSALQLSLVKASRRTFVNKAISATLVTPLLLPLVSQPINALEIVVPDQVTQYEFPQNWGLTFKYDDDAARVRAHMVTATGLGKGADKMEDYGKNLKKEMIDFVSYYRRFPQVSGKPSFSTLYTSINVLAGHYTSYGYKYPLPEKRRKRLYQEYAEIEKSLQRGR